MAKPRRGGGPSGNWFRRLCLAVVAIMLLVWIRLVLRVQSSSESPPPHTSAQPLIANASLYDFSHGSGERGYPTQANERGALDSIYVSTVQTTTHGGDKLSVAPLAGSQIGRPQRNPTEHEPRPATGLLVLPLVRIPIGARGRPISRSSPLPLQGDGTRLDSWLVESAGIQSPVHAAAALREAGILSLAQVRRAFKK